MRNDSASHLATDSEVVRKFGYAIADWVASEVDSCRVRPIYPPAESEKALSDLVEWNPPTKPQDPLQLLERLVPGMLESSANFLHPGMMTWVAATPLPLPGLLDGLLSAIRIFPHAWKLTPGSISIELTVARWLGQMTGFADDSFGYFTSGGTMANLYAATAARSQCAGWDVRRYGLSGCPRLVAYASQHSHICVEQSMALLGIGSENLRRVPLDSNFRMDADCLEVLIEEDIRNGLRPFCVIGTAGTTQTGAVDPLESLADLARKFSLWYHIDGSYGALAALDPAKASYFKGINRADSLAVDPHKWLNIPFESGCILVKDKAVLARAFSCVPSYLVGGDSVSGHDHWHYGFELTRADRAAKVLFAIHQHGQEAFAQMISAHNNFAERLYEFLLRDAEFEPLHKPQLSVLCFRYVNSDCSPTRIDRISLDAELRLQEEGVAFVSSTVLDGRPVLRVCFVNHRTSWDDVRATLERVRVVCRAMVADQSSTCKE